MKVHLRYIRKRLSSFLRSKPGKQFIKWSQRLINIIVLVWLVYELSDIGWENLWNSLPVHPLFYILFLLIYFQLPLFEILIYRITWNFQFLKAVPVFLLKRVYNKDVLGYSGEVYFYLWAREKLPVGDSEILKIIKDNNIISSIASSFISIALLSIFLFTDQIVIIDWVASQDTAYLAGCAIILAVVIFLFVKFRHSFISMPLKTAYTIFGIQTFRLILGQTFNVLMYYVVMPDTPLYIWFTLLSVEIILTRIPFLPNRDLIYTGMSIGIAEGLAVSTSAVAALMVTKSVLNKLANVIAFGIGSFIKRNATLRSIDDSNHTRITSKNARSEQIIN